MRFFGKIMGTQKDYWVAVGVLPQEEETPTSPTTERRGDGVNTSVFWVCNELDRDWIQLPECQTAHIEASRSIKKMLTGNLNAAVQSVPAFPGKERHLLRAQLARI